MEITKESVFFSDYCNLSECSAGNLVKIGEDYCIVTEEPQVTGFIKVVSLYTGEFHSLDMNMEVEPIDSKHYNFTVYEEV